MADERINRFDSGDSFDSDDGLDSDDAGGWSSQDLLRVMKESPLPHLKVSTGVVMFEAGRHVGIQESKGSSVGSSRIWQVLTAAATLLAGMALVGWWSESSQPPVASSRTESGHSDADEAKPKPVTTEVFERTPAYEKHRRTGLFSFGIAAAPRNDLPKSSVLALRNHVLRRGVDDLPEVEQVGFLPAASALTSRQIMLEFSRSGEF